MEALAFQPAAILNANAQAYTQEPGVSLKLNHVKTQFV
jgi:hypothetical protein